MMVENGRIVAITPEEKAALQAELDKTLLHLHANSRPDPHDVAYYAGAESVLSWLVKLPVVPTMDDDLEIIADVGDNPILLAHEDGSFYVLIPHDEEAGAIWKVYRLTDRDDAEILATTGDFYEVAKDRSRRARTIAHEG